MEGEIDLDTPEEKVEDMEQGDQGSTVPDPCIIPPVVHVQYYDSDHAQGIYQLIEAYMLSLQSGPHGSGLRQQVEAVSREAEDEGGVVVSTNQLSQVAEDVDEVMGQVEYHLEYCLDKFPMTYKTQVLFDQVYMEPFWIDKFVEREERRLRRIAIKCFNCGGDHHMNQCTEQLDLQRVIEESRTFKDAIGPQGADKRYHMVQGSERFSKFKPGVISARLRQALGLEPDDIPPYITRMCILGYPPGYKMQAQESALVLYHDPETAMKGVVEDIIYPGFNDTSSLPNGMCLQEEEEEEEEENVREEEGKKEQWKGGGGRRGRRESSRKIPGTRSTVETKEDDLGTLSDYELEEMDGDDGEMVIGFCVKKPSHSPEPPPLEPIPGAKKDKNPFSLDFPPGLVDLDNQLQPTEQWHSIKKILGHCYPKHSIAH